MCRADLTPITMRWEQQRPSPQGNFSSPHTCVKWEEINDWLMKRSVDRIFEPGYLKHPVLGDVYKKGNLDDS
jgi:hypothetical protein